eukprot:CAMPEP_0168766998 /NCGR_PEP_ID=MMETSP0725-20121227/1129_1 /TAXON_ID=265536 /ORGANISM="Amphiprora sp., Strain CCMP467" /LENGTH=379 /DNA_ID=CAMNT_0008816301 /DNA_START=56 /DNA_END=1195 /DNA_ORIENTATION=-
MKPHTKKAEEVPLSFPQRLMEILDNDEYKESIAWHDEGRSMIVLDTDTLVEEIIPRHFSRKSNFSSLKRKFRRWGFTLQSRVTAGAPYIFTHPLFRQGEHRLLAQMNCHHEAHNAKLAREEVDSPSESKLSDASTSDEKSMDSSTNVPGVVTAAVSSAGDKFNKSKKQGHLGMTSTSGNPPTKDLLEIPKQETNSPVASLGVIHALGVAPAPTETLHFPVLGPAPSLAATPRAKTLEDLQMVLAALARNPNDAFLVVAAKTLFAQLREQIQCQQRLLDVEQEILSLRQAQQMLPTPRPAQQLELPSLGRDALSRYHQQQEVLARISRAAGIPSSSLGAATATVAGGPDRNNASDAPAFDPRLQGAVMSLLSRQLGSTKK